MFHFYKFKNKYLFSFHDYSELSIAPEKEVSSSERTVYFLNQIEPLKSRACFTISSPEHLYMEKESLNLLELDLNIGSNNIPQWILDKINERKIKSINTKYPNWEDRLNDPHQKKWKVNLIALGDVGSTLLMGLRLLGGDCIDEIGIYDRNENRLNRWEHEINQIRIPFNEWALPKALPIDKEDLFDCDMFVFCASKGIPAVGSQVSDVRMAQFENNSKIIGEYSKMARDKKFKGIFAVVSDPVDLLCKVAFLESNKDEASQLDFKGLNSEQIIGYGLGVMNGRACFYAEKSKETISYLEEGRVFGPHGEGLIVANSIKNYDEELSDYLTDKTINANKEVRSFGYKPFIAPALSSGTLSILATIRGDWFYGSTYMGGVYMGSKCRLLNTGLEVEQLTLPNNLRNKLQLTYNKLVEII